MRAVFDNIHHETGDSQNVIVPCPCGVGGLEPDKDCPYCQGDGKLQYAIYDLEFIE